MKLPSLMTLAVSLFFAHSVVLAADDLKPYLADLKVAEDLFSSSEKNDDAEVRRASLEAALKKMLEIQSRYKKESRVQIYLGIAQAWNDDRVEAEKNLIQGVQRLILELKDEKIKSSKATELTGIPVIKNLATEVRKWMELQEKGVKKKDRASRGSQTISFDRKVLILGITALAMIHGRNAPADATDILYDACQMTMHSFYYFDDVTDVARVSDCFMARAAIVDREGRASETKWCLTQWENIQESWRDLQIEKAKRR